MKVIRKIFFILISLMAFCGLLLLTACEKKENAGTVYELYQITESDRIYEIGDEWNGEILTKDFYELTLFDNHRFILSGVYMEKIEGEWEQSENSITISSDMPDDNDIVLLHDEENQTLHSVVVGGDHNIVFKKR